MVFTKIGSPVRLRTDPPRLHLNSANIELKSSPHLELSSCDLGSRVHVTPAGHFSSNDHRTYDSISRAAVNEKPLRHVSIYRDAFINFLLLVIEKTGHEAISSEVEFFGFKGKGYFSKTWSTRVGGACLLTMRKLPWRLDMLPETKRKLCQSSCLSIYYFWLLHFINWKSQKTDA